MNLADILCNPFAVTVSSTVTVNGTSVLLTEKSFQNPPDQRTALAAKAIEKISNNPAAIRKVRDAAKQGDERASEVATAVFNYKLARAKVACCLLGYACAQGDPNACARARALFQDALTKVSLRTRLLSRMVRDSMRAFQKVVT